MTRELLELKHSSLTEHREFTEKVARLSDSLEEATLQVDELTHAQEILTESLPEEVVNLLRRLEPALRRQLQLARKHREMLATMKGKEIRIREAFEKQKELVEAETKKKLLEVETEGRRRAKEQALPWKDEQDAQSRLRAEGLSEQARSRAEAQVESLRLSQVCPLCSTIHFLSCAG